MDRMSDEPDVVIERRFNGPPDSGHGGYSAGRAAALVDGPAEVTLRRPPPLETPLTVRRDDGGAALCLFCGPVGDGRFAVPWTPPDWTGEGAVDPVFAWAALDCPSSAPVHGTVSGPVVLGRLAIALEAPIEVGAPHVIQSWLVRSDGRKRETAVALFAEAGDR